MVRSIVAALLLTACRPQAGTARTSKDWERLVHPAGDPTEARPPVVVSDSALKPYLPERLFGRTGARPQGSMTRIGGRSLTEVSRSYLGPTGPRVQAELKLADARFEPRATEAIRSMAAVEFDSEGAARAAPDELSDAQRLILPGAIGYARYDEDERVAQAQVVIGGRFIASARVLGAAGPQDAVAALRSLDTLGISHLAESN